MLGLLIPAIGTIGLPLLEKLWKNSPEWIDLIKEAVAGIPIAVAAISNLIRGQDEGRDWTADELRVLLAEARGVHDAIQATGSAVKSDTN
jgi:hypothetical protein